MNTSQHQLFITAEWISEYVQSIEAPLHTIHGKLIAPATMPVVFWHAFDIPWLDKDVPTLHGSQHYKYKEPITEGMLLNCELALTNVESKAGRRGKLTFFTHTLVCTYNGDLIVTAETVLIRVGVEHEETHNS